MTKYIATVLGVIILMIDGYDLQCIGFVAPEIARSWSVGIAAFGPIFSAGLAGTIPGAMLAGPGARLLGHRAALFIALLIFGGGTLATAWANSLAVLAPLRFVVGLGLGAAVPLIVILVADNTPARFRATVVTLTLCGQPLGAVLGAALCARLVPAFGWQAAFFLGGLLPLALLPAVFAFREKTTAGAQPHAAHGIGVPSGRVGELFNRQLLSTTLLLWASAFLAAVVVYVILNWLPGMVRGAGYSMQVSMLAIGFFNFGGIAGALLFGVLIDRFGPLKVVAPAFLLAGVCLSLLDLTRDALPLFLAASLMSGFAAYGGAMSFGAMTILLYPSAMRTTGVGWVLGIGRTGGAISPLAAGAALAAGMAAGTLFYFAAAAAVLAALCLFVLGGARMRSAGMHAAQVHNAG